MTDSTDPGIVHKGDAAWQKLRPVLKLAEIARRLDVTIGAIAKWTRVPAERVLKVEEVTGIPRHELRPDLYPPPAAASEAAA